MKKKPTKKAQSNNVTDQLFGALETSGLESQSKSTLQRQPVPQSQLGEDRIAAVGRRLLEARTIVLNKGHSDSELRQYEVEARVGLAMDQGSPARIGPDFFGRNTLPLPTLENGQEIRIAVDLHARSVSEASRGAPHTFKPKVSRVDFERIRALVRSLFSGAPGGRTNLEETVYFGDSMRGRIVERQGEGTAYCEVKEPLSGLSGGANQDLVLPTCPYDLRLSVQREAPCGVASGGYQKRAQRKRHKIRESFRVPTEGFSSGGGGGGGAVEGQLHDLQRRLGCCWQLDLTIVEEQDVVEAKGSGDGSSSSSAEAGIGASGVATRHYEIELELTPFGREQWLQPYLSRSGATAAAAAAAAVADETTLAMGDLARQLFLWADLVNPFDDANPADATRCLALVQDKRSRLANRICENLASASEANALPRAFGGAGGGQRHNARFPGAMPVNLMKRHIKEVQQSSRGGVSYFVTEKTDGERQLLVSLDTTSDTGIGAGGTEGSALVAVFVDRSEERGGFKTRSFPGAESLKLPSGTVLDGELVFNLVLRRPVFMVFDVLQVEGPHAGSVLNLIEQQIPFQGRLQYLQNPSIKERLDATIADINNKDRLIICTKRFFSSAKIGKIFANMSTHSGHHIYHIPRKHSEPGLEVKHKCDGIILQPDAPYKSGTDHHLFKWKFLDHVTVDMRVRFADGCAAFSCKFGGHLDYDCQQSTVSLDEFETARLLADVKAHIRSGATESIAEIGLDPTSGQWFYHTLRRDKTVANHIHTVFSTLTGLAENVTAEELQYRLQAGDGPDCDLWDTEREAQVKHLLDLQQRAQKQQRLK